MKLNFYLTNSVSLKWHEFFMTHRDFVSQDITYDKITSLIENGTPILYTFSKRFDLQYFYNPVYGYCTCDEVFDFLWNKVLLTYHTQVCCLCGGKLVYPEIEIDNHIEILDGNRICKENFFPKDFRKVLEIRRITINNISVLAVYTVNVMDVYQISPNEFDVGIGCFFLYDHPYHSSNSILFSPGSFDDLTYPSLSFHVVRHYQIMRDYSVNFILENENQLFLKCRALICEWLLSGVICQNDLFEHVLSTTYERNKPPKFDNNNITRYYLNIKYIESKKLERRGTR